jgi:sulfur-oxidizing protein SoxZ
MKIRATTKDGVTEVKALMAHPMETGLRKDADGQPVPAHYISEVTATWNDKVVMAAKWGPAVSQNPFLQFRFKGGAPGDKVTVSWKDNTGDSRSDEAVLA